MELTENLSPSKRGLEWSEDKRAKQSNGKNPQPLKDGQRVLDRERLRYEDDCRAFLYRHWTLKEALQHTALVYGRMRLHKESGMDHVRQFFAECGVEYKEACQLWGTLPHFVSHTLVQKFKNLQRRHNLTGFVKPTLRTAFLPQTIKLPRNYFMGRSGMPFPRNFHSKIQTRSWIDCLVLLLRTLYTCGEY